MYTVYIFASGQIYSVLCKIVLLPWNIAQNSKDLGLSHSKKKKKPRSLSFEHTTKTRRLKKKILSLLSYVDVDIVANDIVKYVTL